MSAILPSHGVLHRETSAGWPAADRGSSAAIHHVLDGLAGFHASEVAALTTVDQLAGSLGVKDNEMVLLGPTDASWPRFVRLARQWNRRPHGQGGTSIRTLGIVMLFTALGAALLTSTLLQQREYLSFELELLATCGAAFFGAVLACSLVALLHRQQPQFKDFDLTVRRKLAQGFWVVVVHDLPWKRQAAVVEMISQRSSNWCAVSSARESR